jgi:hypothetical protein
VMARRQDSAPAQPNSAATRAVESNRVLQPSATTNIINAATHTIASTLGVLVGVGSIDHGILECLQGPRPTPRLIVSALEPGYSWTIWKQGGEGAFTLLPNFLASGIIASLLGVAMIIWALSHIESRHGPIVFLSLAMLSFLSGGGVAQIVLFTLTWGVATRIRAPLVFWRRLIPAAARPPLSRIWPWTLIAATALFLAALEIAIFGYVPGVVDQLRILHICWIILGVAVGLYLVSICSGFAEDIDAQESRRGKAHRLFPQSP